MRPTSVWQLIWRMIGVRRYHWPEVTAARQARLDAEHKLRQTEQLVEQVKDEFGRRINGAWRKDP